MTRAAAGGPASERRSLILNVDDDEIARYARTRTLTHGGFEVIEAATGRAALAAVQAHAPALVLLDVRLPDLSGIEVCRVIKDRWPATLVLQISATFVRPDDRTRGLDGGADSYLVQPIDPGELVAAIRALLRLRAAEESMRELNDTLEQRIAQRTAELSRANALLVEQIAQRERAEQALVQAQKLDAIGQLTGVMAHDFNNVLAALSNYLHLIRSRTTDTRSLDLIDRSQAVVRRGSKLTSRVLAFARTSPMAQEPLDIVACLRGMADWLQDSAGSGVEVVMRLDAPADARPDAADLVAVVDANQFELAILNLVVNSRDATPAGGQVVLSAARQDGGDDTLGPLPEGVLEVFAHDTRPQPGPHVVVAVSDSGLGMAADTARRAFDTFYTTKPPGRGTGLGLSQVTNFVSHCGGASRLRTGPGRGTTVELWLPCAPRGPAQATGGAAPAQGQRRTALVVDDDGDVRSTLSDLLAAHAYAVTTADSGAQALALLEHLRPDVLLLDVSMPGLAGTEVARRHRQAHPGQPIVFVTGNADLAELWAFGSPCAVVRKPFVPATLLAAMARVLAAPDAASTREPGAAADPTEGEGPV